MRAVDGISFDVGRNEIYGLAGESSSRQDHADQDHRRRHPAAARGRRRHRSTFNFLTGAIEHARAPTGASWRAIRWRHLSYIMQGSMNVLNPVRRVRHAFVDFAFRHIGRPMPAFLRRGARRISRALHLDARRARRLSARALRRHAPARHDRARHRLPARVHHRRRADHGARRRGAEGRAGDDPRGPARDRLVDPVRHPRHGRARQPHRPPRHHVCRPPGRGGPHAPTSSARRAIPTPRT